MSQRNFRPRVTEPQIRPGVIGVGIEFELYERIKGIDGNSIVIYLEEGTSMDQAEELCRTIGQLGVSIAADRS